MDAVLARTAADLAGRPRPRGADAVYIAAAATRRLPLVIWNVEQRQRVDLILAFGASESIAAAKATATIPIVFMSPTPVELGLVRSLARPGGNVSGMSVTTDPAVIGKLLELLKTMVPGLSRVALLIDPDRPGLAVAAGDPISKPATSGVARSRGLAPPSRCKGRDTLIPCGPSARLTSRCSHCRSGHPD